MFTKTVILKNLELPTHADLECGYRTHAKKNSSFWLILLLKKINVHYRWVVGYNLSNNMEQWMHIAIIGYPTGKKFWFFILFTTKKHDPARYPKPKLPLFPVFYLTAFFLTCIQVSCGILLVWASLTIFFE